MTIQYRLALSPSEMQIAGEQGAARYVRAAKNGWKETVHNPNLDHKAKNIYSAQAEYAAAKFLNQCWILDINQFKNGADVGYDIGVKSTDGTYREYFMLVNLEDRRSDNYVFVRYAGERIFEIRGWAEGDDVMQPENLRTTVHGTSYWYPEKWLRHVSELCRWEDIDRINQHYLPPQRHKETTT